MRQVREEITKERYEELEKMDGKERAKVISNEIPIEWAIGYGWYGCFLAKTEDKYFIVHNLGSTCD